MTTLQFVKYKINSIVDTDPMVFIIKFSRKEYFPNLMESAMFPGFCVFKLRDFKFWLLAYFLISFNRAKFQ